MSGVSLITGGKGIGDRSPTDLYPTPYPSTQSLLDYIKDKGYSIHTVLEPCAGLGHIAKVIKDNYPNIHIEANDLHDYSAQYSYVYPVNIGKCALEKHNNTFDWVITNPPFDSKVLLPIVKNSLNTATTGVAMFLKGTFLETVNRMEFFKKNKQLKYILVFANRQPLYKNGTVTKASNAIMYAWFVWDKNYKGLPKIDWLNNSEECKDKTNLY